MKDLVDVTDQPVTVTSIPRATTHRIQIPAKSLLVVGLCATVATVVAYFLSSRQPTMYGASVDILVSTRGYSTDMEIARLLETQKFLIRSERVLRPASAKLGMDYRRLAAAVRVSLVGETEVLRVVVEASDRNAAVRGATEVSASYIRNAWIPPAVSINDQHLRNLIASLADVRDDLARLDPDASSSLERRRLEITEAALAKQVDAEHQRLSTLESERSIPPDARIVAPARPLDSPVRPRRERAVVAGFAVGLLVGGAGLALQRTVARGVVLLWK